VGHLGERALDGDADVVDEAVDTPERDRGRLDYLLGRAPLGEVGNDVERLADARRLAPPAARDDARAFGGEQPRGLQTDPARRSCDDADAVAEAEVHRATL